MVHYLMNRKEIELLKSIDPSINVITGTTYLETSSLTGPRPITIFHDNKAARTEMPKVPIQVLIMEVSRPFPYESQKAIPWDYNCNYTYQTTVNDLTSVRGISRNGRCYAPDMAEKVTSEKLLLPTSEEQPSKEKE